MIRHNTPEARRLTHDRVFQVQTTLICFNRSLGAKRHGLEPNERPFPR